MFAIFFAAWGWSCKQDDGYYFSLPVITISKLLYGTGPLYESIPIAQFIRKNTKEGDRVAILGSEPQILFYADRLPAAGYLYMYSLMENQRFNLAMQKEMAGEIEKNKAVFLVFVNIHESWLTRPESPKYLMGWMEKYIKDNYSLNALVKVYSYKDSEFSFVNNLTPLALDTKDFILIFRRKEA
jgi:hypothetical protein